MFLLVHVFVAQVIAFFLSSLLNSLIGKNNEYGKFLPEPFIRLEFALDGWRTVWLVKAIILVATNGLFYLTASTEPANWTNEGKWYCRRHVI